MHPPRLAKKPTTASHFWSNFESDPNFFSRARVYEILWLLDRAGGFFYERGDAPVHSLAVNFIPWQVKRPLFWRYVLCFNALDIGYMHDEQSSARFRLRGVSA
jgi:hypothetical protein